MSLIIEGGISIGGSITITAEHVSPTSNLIVFYDAGNSMCYNGSGSTFNTAYTGPNLDTYYQFGVVDLAGQLNNTWNSGNLSTFLGGNITWTNQGVGSYWTLDTANQNYIDSTWQQNATVPPPSPPIPTLNSPTYTMLAVVRSKDFSQGAVVGGDENVFAFINNGGFNDGPCLVAANSYGDPSFVPAVTDTTTAFELDTWYCVAVSYDAGSQTMKLYTNGVLVDTAIGVAPITHPTGLYWGTLEGQLWFTGDIAVSMAYERVLGDSEIDQLSTVYLSRYIQPVATNSVVYDLPVDPLAPPILFTVPAGVTSISVVAVGGGGGGTADEYAIPGGDTFVVKLDNSVNVTTTYTGTSNTIIVDTAAYPNIATVTVGNSWIVGSSVIPGPVPAVDLVVGVDTSNPASTVITIDKYINTTAGDQFGFYQAVATAEGGYEIAAAYYNRADVEPNPSGGPYNAQLGPGARALPLVTDGPYGAGGVVDWTTYYPIGGGGAGGYGITGLAWNPQQSGEYYFNSSGIAIKIGPTMTFGNNNLTVTATAAITTVPSSVTLLATQAINPGDRVVFTVRQDVYAPDADYTGIGVGTIDTNLWNYVGQDTSGFSFWDDGVYNAGGTASGASPIFQSNGDRLDVAVARDTNLIWLRVNGGYWNNDPAADPAADTGGFDISYIVGTIYPAITPWYASGIAGVYTMPIFNYYATPSGFTQLIPVAGAGGTGGDGVAYWGSTGTPGTGSAGGGGGGLYENSGAGGGGSGLYGAGANGSAGTMPAVYQLPSFSSSLNINNNATVNLSIVESNTTGIVFFAIPNYGNGGIPTPPGYAQGWNAVGSVQNEGSELYQYVNMSYLEFSTPQTNLIVDSAGDLYWTNTGTGLTTIADALVGVTASPTLVDTNTAQMSSDSVATVTFTAAPGTVVVLASGAESGIGATFTPNIISVTGLELTWTRRAQYYDPTSDCGQTAELWYAINNAGSTAGDITITFDTTIDDQATVISSYAGCNLTTPWATVTTATTAPGGGGGSDNTFSGSPGGDATLWNGGRGGWPGGAGGSATGYWVAGNGGALAYRNNYAVTPGDSYAVVVGLGGQGQNNGGSGAVGGVRIVWPGDVRQFPATNVGADNAFSITITASPGGQAQSGPVTYAMYPGDPAETVTESGVIWGLPGYTTIADSIPVCSSPGYPYTGLREELRENNNPSTWDPNCGNAVQTGQTGSVTQYIQFNNFQGDDINIVAYATTASGTYYSAPIAHTVNICLAEGTLVTLADGSTRAIEAISATDSIQVWDFDTGVVASAVPLWIKQKQSTIQYNLIRFSDGSELKTISQHRIFNKQAGAFTYPMTAATPIGTITVKSDGTEVSVVSKQVVYDVVNYYNVVTAGGYMNLYANGILTSMRYNNIYPIADMQYVKDARVLRDRAEFVGIADRWIDGLRLTEQTTDIQHIRRYVKRLEANEAREQSIGVTPAWHK